MDMEVLNVLPESMERNASSNNSSERISNTADNSVIHPFR